MNENTFTFSAMGAYLRLRLSGIFKFYQRPLSISFWCLRKRLSLSKFCDALMTMFTVGRVKRTSPDSNFYHRNFFRANTLLFSCTKQNFFYQIWQSTCGKFGGGGCFPSDRGSTASLWPWTDKKVLRDEM